MEITPIFMVVMDSKFNEKNYAICRNPIYSSKYTLSDEQKQIFYNYSKTLEIRVVMNNVFIFPYIDVYLLCNNGIAPYDEECGKPRVGACRQFSA